MTTQMTDAMSRIYSCMTGDHRGNWGMDINHWDWVPGVGVISILDYGEKTGQEEVIHYVQTWVERNKQKADDQKVINAMAPYAVFPSLYRRTGQEWLLAKSQEIAKWMLNEAPRTRERAFEHTVTEAVEFREQVWADTVFMAVLFLARLAKLKGDKQLAEEALEQTMLHLQLLQDTNTGLLYHGWNCEAGNHLSAVHWARANAWIVMSIPEIMTEISELSAIPAELNERYRTLADALRSCQAVDGLWHTVLDRVDTYKETSASAGIACGFLRGIDAGLLDTSFMEPAERTLAGVLSLIDPAGEVAGVSGGTPIMPSVDAYNQIKIYPTLYGQGLTLQLLTQFKLNTSEG
ncbi:unsaturated rhamnogalacturonyl hydrolase [Paenibacillus castaneae]|uniref:glycoside hydrolase family 88/105 protein n=1 Tax=Paenibacillus castaneae TaxID=474957 RepID=UPI001FB8EA6D|nr:glycoside hydrolase family 88 protein [Paenibacillus castaneae]NIK78998.1 unsaturated rhamnogalacturonyl hydrolase [Paenibacillus castaneae]